MNVISVEQLSSQSFIPFGEVIETKNADQKLINEGNTVRFHKLATSTAYGKNAKSIISIFRGEPRELPFQVKMMERHPLGAQAFYPLNNHPWLVVVSEDDNGKPSQPKAFIAQANQGVNYRPNVWHHPLMALDQVCEFLVVDRDGEGDNIEEYFFQQPFLIDKKSVDAVRGVI